MTDFADIASLGEAAEILGLSKRQAERVLSDAGIDVGQLSTTKGAKIVSRSAVQRLAAERLRRQRAALADAEARLQGAAS